MIIILRIGYRKLGIGYKNWIENLWHQIAGQINGYQEVNMKIGSCKVCKRLLNLHFKKDRVEIRNCCSHIGSIKDINHNFSLKGKKKIILKIGGEK